MKSEELLQKEIILPDVKSKGKAKIILISSFVISHLIALVIGFILSYTILNKKEKQIIPVKLNSNQAPYHNGPLYDIIEKPCPKNHTHTLIYLHGLTGSALLYTENMTNPNFPLVPDTTKVVLLVAPFTEKNQTSWFDIEAPWTVGRHNYTQVTINAQRVIDVINKEAEELGGDYSKIFLMGYSQGGCISMYISLTIPQNLGGVVMQSAVIFPEIYMEPTFKNNTVTKFLVGHGTKDEAFPIDTHKETVKYFSHHENFLFRYYEGVTHASWESIKIDAQKFFYEYMK